MEKASIRLTKYIINTGVASEELFDVYKYGFQMGLEMLSCFIVCLILATYFHLVPDFFLASLIFISLRSYAGGVHLNSFGTCFLCSIIVQTAILLINDVHSFSFRISWAIIIMSIILIGKASPVENVNRELNYEEKVHCKKITVIILGVILGTAGLCTIINLQKEVSLIALTILLVMCSQYLGIAVSKIGKSKKSRNLR